MQRGDHVNQHLLIKKEFHHKFKKVEKDIIIGTLSLKKKKHIQRK